MAKSAQPWPRGEVGVAMIGLVERIVDSKGRDVSLDPLVLERMADCANAVTDIWFPAAHIGRAVELLAELRELRDAAVAKRDAAKASRPAAAAVSHSAPSKVGLSQVAKGKRPCSFGPYTVEKIGEVHRLLDGTGADILRHSDGIRRVVDALNAFRKVPDPVEYRTAVEADCRRLEDQRASAWSEYEALEYSLAADGG